MNVSEQVDFLLKLGERLDNLVSPGGPEDYLIPGMPLVPEAIKDVPGFFPCRVLDVLLYRWVRIKDFTTQGNVRFLANPGQIDFSRGLARRNIALKSGRTGFTSYVAQRNFLRTITRRGHTAILIAHEQKPAEDYFQQVEMSWRLLPNPLGEQLRKGALRLGKHNTKELFFPELNSHYYVETAGDKLAGIGASIQSLHCTEFAKWTVSNPGQVLANLISQLTGDFTEATIESRPFGDVGQFHELYQEAKRGDGAWKPHFYQWWWNPAMIAPYTAEFAVEPEEKELAARYAKWRAEEAPQNCGLPLRLNKAQLAWRRNAKKELKDLFPQEFAEDEVECFIASGNCPFSADSINRILGDLTPVIERNSGTGEPENGLLRWRDPADGYSYIVFADLASTLHVSRNAAEVFCFETGEQVAEWVGRCDALTYAAIIRQLGMLYNAATVAYENNLGEISATVAAALADYPNIFIDTIGGQKRFGWKTSEATRPMMIDLFSEALKSKPELFHSRRLAAEAKNCEHNGRRVQAKKGGTDDTVLATGGALAVIQRMRQEGRTAPKPWVDFVVSDTRERGWRPI